VDTRHIVLVGDSIFDNGAYTGHDPDVVSHLRAKAAGGWKATLVAVDGSTTSSVPAQAARVPADASHIVVAVGGNDALGNQDLLAAPVRSSADTLAMFAKRVAQFERAYRAAIDAVLALQRNTTLCTVYNGNLEEPRATLARVGLTIFNDVILRVAFERRLDVVDLRLVCSEPEDYANQIEPSGRGGAKIADAILKAVGATDAAFSRVYA
jgi:hypothetical protein